MPAEPVLVDLAAAAETPTEADIRAWASGQRVFISSVMGGMRDVRTAAADAVERLGATPVLFERFGGMDADPSDAYLGQVRSSSIYLGLLGRAYGRQLPSGFSATHEEYLTAADKIGQFPAKSMA